MRGRRGRLIGGGNPAAAYFSAMPTPLTSAEKALVSSFVNGLIADNLWRLFDRIGIRCLGTQAQSLVDLKDPSRSATIYATPALTFTPNRGFTGSSSADTTNLPDSINTGFIPSAAGGQMTLNSSSIGMYVATNTSSANVAFGANGTNDLYVIIRNASSNSIIRSNNVTNVTIATGTILDASGLYILSRTAADVTKSYIGGAQVGVTSAQASVGLADAPVRFLQVAAQPGTPYTDCFDFVGGGLNDAQAAAFTNRVNTLVTGLRAL